MLTSLAANPIKVLNLFWSRKKALAKRRATPFNLKEASKTFKPRVARPSTYPLMGWVGPWVLVTSPLRGDLSRLCLYTYNAIKLWVACPSRGGLSKAEGGWFRSTLRGLRGLVTLKLRFKGKSFRWHRRKGALVLRFGHSHLVACKPPKGIRWKKGGKTKMIFFSSNVTVLKNYLAEVVSWREPNRYHSRGLRLSRQKIVRKAGKVSAYR